MKPHFLRLMILGIIINSLLTFTGCWDLEEVDRRAFATLIGIDTGSKGEVILSCQFPQAGRLLPPGIEGGGKPGKTFSTITASGRSPNEAFRMFQTLVYRRSLLQHNHAIIIGETAARQGVVPLLDWLLRYPKASTTALIMVAKDRTAKEILEFTPVQETLPGTQIFQASQERLKHDRTYFISNRSFLQKLFHKSKDPFATLIDIDSNQGSYQMAGIAVFSGARLAGELDIPDTQNFGILQGLIKSGSLTFDLPGVDKRRLTLIGVNSKRKIKVSFQDNVPFYTVEIVLSGTLNELINGGGVIGPKRVEQLEKEVELLITPALEKTIYKLQQMNSDVIDFGEKLRVQHYEYWKKVNWRELYPTVPFKVRVKVKILRNGVIR